MKKLFLISLIVLLSTSAKKPERELYIAGCANNYIGRVDYKSGAYLWKFPVTPPEDCNDIELTKKGVLYAYKGGARLLNEKGEQIWNYTAPDGCELYTATKSKYGYLLAMCGAQSLIVQLNQRGELIKKTTFDTGVKNVHGQLRQIIETKNNTFLIPVMASGELIEIDNQGNVLKRIKTGGTPFSVHNTNTNGEYMVSCGDASKIVFINLEKQKIVREIRNEDIKGDVKMLFVAELKMLKNGNILIANWNGHVNDKTQPQIFEIDSQNRVVSKIGTNKMITNVSAFNLKDR